MSTVIVRIPKSEVETIDALSDVYEASRSEMIRRIVYEYLDDNDDKISRLIEDFQDEEEEHEAKINDIKQDVLVSPDDEELPQDDEDDVLDDEDEEDEEDELP